MYKNLSMRSKRRKIKEVIEDYNLISVIEPSEPSCSSNTLDVIPHQLNNNLNYEIECEENQINRISISSFDSLTNIDNLVEDLDLDNQLPLKTQNDVELNNLSSESLCSELAQWSIENKISHSALNGILIILKKHRCFNYLPKDARTLLKTKPVLSELIRDVTPGSYYHFGIENGIKRHLIQIFSSSEIKLVVGIDGLPITKSNSTQFWPILAYIRPSSNKVFPIGLYCGSEKPRDSNEYLEDFVTEAKNIILNGIYINNKFYKVVLDGFCCDVPAKAFVLKTKGHSGFYSCFRCEIEGEYLENRLCFPYSEPLNRPPMRTHNSYVNRSQVNHHASHNNSCLIEIPDIDIVNYFSIDYMHAVCLGAVKKLIILWMKGPLNVRLPSWKINEISEKTVNLKSEFLCEFSRKPRSLVEIARFKATELRSFLLYIGPIVLENVLSDNCYNNFKALSVAMTILLSPGLSKYVEFAQELLEYFVKSFEQIYGQHLISSNIHSLIHLVDDYKKYGHLDNCSAFPFENHMKILKAMIRKPHKPLEQVIMRYNENGNLDLQAPYKSNQLKTSNFLGFHNRGPLLNNLTENPQYSTLVLHDFEIKSKIDADSYFCTNNNNIVKLVNIAHLMKTKIPVLIGRQFLQKKDFFTQPIRSSYFGIYIVQELSDDLEYWHLSDVKNKLMIFPHNNDLVAIPLLHTI